MLVLTGAIRYRGRMWKPHFTDSFLWLCLIHLVVVAFGVYSRWLLVKPKHTRVSSGTRSVVAFQQGCTTLTVTEVLDRPRSLPRWMFILWDDVESVPLHSNGALIGDAYNLGYEIPCCWSFITMAHVKTIDLYVARCWLKTGHKARSHSYSISLIF